MKYEGFIEILPGIYYEEATGDAYSTRQVGRGSKIPKAFLTKIILLDKDGYMRVSDVRNGKRYHLRWHRVVYEFFKGKIPEGFVVDHIDNNVSNNKIDNLQAITALENNRKCKKFSTNKSGYAGVTWHKHHKKWQATIEVHHKCIFLGYYDDPKEASQAYLNYKKLHQGEQSIQPLIKEYNNA